MAVGTKEMSEDIYMYMCIYICMLAHLSCEFTHTCARFSRRLYMAGGTKEEKTACLEKACITIALFTSISWRRRRRRRRRRGQVFVFLLMAVYYEKVH
jgi:hypothetical protein